MIRFPLAALLLLFALRVAAAESTVDLGTRPGVVQPVYVTDARNAVASVILFPGSNGLVQAEHANFLLRVADRFVAQGITVAVADTPSDHPRGMDPSFRASEAHAEDMADIVTFLQGRTRMPVWLVGTSNGSISAANAAVRIGPPRIAGVVLTSSVWNGGMSQVPLAALRVPVLIVHNRDDTCPQSPPALAEGAFAALRQAPARDLLLVSGGRSVSAPCKARSSHGYYGIEDQVVPAIIAWIKGH